MALVFLYTDIILKLSWYCMSDIHIGKDGWVFLTGGSNSVLDTFKDLNQRDSWVSSWRGLIKNRVNSFANNGIEYIHVMAPEKVSIYNRYLNGINFNQENTPSKILSKMLDEEMQKHFIDPTDFLIKQSENYQVYHKTDSHWNIIGAYSVYQLIMYKLGLEEDKSLLSRLTSIETILDLSSKLDVPRYERISFYSLPDSVKCSYENDLVRFKKDFGLENEPSLHTGSHVEFKNSAAKYNKKVIIFGDSFSEYRPHLLTGLLSSTFSDVVFIWNHSIDYNKVRDFNADIVIAEVAERFIPKMIPNDDLNIDSYSKRRLKTYLDSNSISLRKSPVVHAYVICYNEEDIIEHTLTHYSSFCSKIFLFDNGSTDSTLQKASKFKKVKVINFDTGGKKNNKYHSYIKSEEYKNYSRKGGQFTEEVADWIICVDSDELIYHPRILDVLAEYDLDGVTVPQITGFNIVGEKELTDSPSIIDQYDMAVREPIFDKRAVFKCSFNMPNSPGCHPYGSAFKYMQEMHDYKTSNKHKLALLHYKHIGSRLLETAKTNLSRFDETQITRNEKGHYEGPGAQYKFYIEADLKKSYLIRDGKSLFKNGRDINFDSFTETTGESGALIQGSPYILDSEVDELICIVDKICKEFKTEASKLLSFMYKHRPENKKIENAIVKQKDLKE